MGKKTRNIKTPVKPALSTKEAGLKPTYRFIVMAYLILPVIMPNFHTWDSNGPRFLTIAALNLISFIVLSSNGQFFPRPPISRNFFRSFIGIAYTLFLAFSLISMAKAINLNEAVLNFIKTFTIFMATYNLFLIFRIDRRYFLDIILAIAILLIIDCLSVFYFILEYIAREVSSIMDIKSVYSHKNILASALFVKLPAAIFLTYFSTGWKKKLGYIAFSFAVLSILLLSTRAFYLGLALVLVTMMIFLFVRYRIERKRERLLSVFHLTGLFLIAVLLYVAAQSIIFPKNTDIIWNTGIISRLSSIKEGESSTQARLGAWKRSVKLISENPVMGVGTGNWKVAVLKYENPGAKGFIYMCKSHNDFLEIASETGLPGGLAFIAIFIFIFTGFFSVAISSPGNDDRLKYLFLPAFGLLAYSVDAFFNFPADRPEIQSLFAIYLAAGILFSGDNLVLVKNAFTKVFGFLKWESVKFQKIAAFTIMILLCFSAYILFCYSKSLYYQRLAKENLQIPDDGNLAANIVAGFPVIPNLSLVGEPIVVNKARYLIKEQKYEEAKTLLLVDHSSPYDSRREYFIAAIYQQNGNEDSAIAWLRKVYVLKPLYPDATKLLGYLLFKNGKQQEAMDIMDRLAYKSRTNSDVWFQAAYMHFQAGSPSKALIILDSAVKYLPADTLLVNQRNRVAKMLK